MKITDEGFAIVERDSHIGKWVIDNKRLDFDQNAIPLIMKHIKKNDCVLDIGSNIGAYAYAFGKKANMVYCFEPNKEIFDCLEYNAKRFIKNALLYNTAVSDVEFNYKSVIDNDNIGMAHIEPCKSGNKTLTIDSLNLVGCDFVKIDVEGYELAVLKGMECTIDKYRPIMVIEINNATLDRVGIKPIDIYNFLTLKGYVYRNIYPDQGLEDSQLDIICFP